MDRHDCTTVLVIEQTEQLGLDVQESGIPPTKLDVGFHRKRCHRCSGPALSSADITGFQDGGKEDVVAERRPIDLIAVAMSPTLVVIEGCTRSDVHASN